MEKVGNISQLLCYRMILPKEGVKAKAQRGNAVIARAKYRDWIGEAGLRRIEKWSGEGLTDEQIAEKIGICPNTFGVWRRKYAEIVEAIERGSQTADERVENALFKKAQGYTARVRKAYKLKDVVYENGKKVSETERIEYAEEETYIPADIKAQIFWLVNRRGDVWHEKAGVLSTSDDGAEVVIISGEAEIKD